MTMLDRLKKILKNLPDSWEELVQELSYLVEAREVYQLVLAEVASSVKQKLGGRGLHDLAVEIEENTGRNMSFFTLKKYALIYENLKDLDIPDDIPFSVRRLLAESKDPKHYLHLLLEEGLSAKELAKKIKGEEGFSVCPTCGRKLNVKKSKK